MTSTIFFALRSRSSFLLIASTPRYAKRERQTRLLSFCLSVVLRAKKRESAHTTARWKGEEKFLKCFSWNERTFELVFFFSKFSILVQNESHKNKRKGEKSRALFEKEEETKTEKRVVVGRFSSPNDASKRVTNVMIPPIISQNTLFLLRLKLSTQTLSPRRSAK